MASSSDNSEPVTILSLSDEILVQIFCLVPEPQHFTVTCSRIQKISQDPWTRSKYFMQYGKTNAFNLALAKGRLLTPRCIDIMISSGALLSRYLIQAIIGHYTKGNIVKHIRGNWCRSMKYSSFAHFVHIGALRYGDEIDIGKGSLDALTVESYINAKISAGSLGSEALDERWIKVREIFEKFNFIPFDEKDPAMKAFPSWVSTEPRLLPLARKNGFGILEDWREVVLKNIFAKSMSSSHGPHDGEAARLAKLVAELTELDPAIFMSRTLAGSICLDRIRHPHCYAALKMLNSTHALRFELSSLIADLFKLFSDSFLLYSKEMVTVLYALYNDFPMPNDPIVRPIMILSIFAQATPALDLEIPPGFSASDTARIAEARSAAVNKISERIEEFKLAPLTKLDIMQVLESRITLTERPLFKYVMKNQNTMGITSTDIQNIAESTAVASLSRPAKGSMVKRLVRDHSGILPSIRTAMARFDVSVDDLVAPESRSEAPIWASLGASLESPKDDFSRAESTPHDLGKLSISSITSPGLHAAHHELGTLRCCNINDSTTLTVPDWILDQFGPRSREAAISFTHALLVCAGDDSPYLKRCRERGVPVTLKHFKMRFALGLEMPQRIWDMLREQEYYATELDYLSPVEKHRMEANSTTDSGERQAKRPRRQAAKAVATYALLNGASELADDAATTTSSTTKHEMELDGEMSDGESAQAYSPPPPTAAGATRSNIYDNDAEDKDRLRADQLALWIKNLADILHEEARKLRLKKKAVGRNDRGQPNQRTAKTTAHIELLKRLPPLRKREAELRQKSANGAGAEVGDETLVDDVKDRDWEDPRKKRKRRTELYTGVPTSDA